jgi:hypothetical protein
MTVSAVFVNPRTDNTMECAKECASLNAANHFLNLGGIYFKPIVIDKNIVAWRK